MAERPAAPAAPVAPTGLWARWSAYANAETDPRPLALVRILISLVVLADLAQAARLGLVPVFWRPYAQGGLSLQLADGWAFVQQIDPRWGGPATVGVVVICMLCAIFGVATRPALLVGALAYAQLGHLYPPGDRAVDRMLRTAMLLLAASGSHQVWAPLRRGPAATRIPAWPQHLLTYALVLMYLSAGVDKVLATPAWLGLWPNDLPLLRILGDPMSAWPDPAALAPHRWLWRLGGLFTILLEISAPLLLTRWAPWWALLGLGMHLGIAATMELGMFAWGMMAMYPIFFVTWWPRARAPAA